MNKKITSLILMVLTVFVFTCAYFGCKNLSRLQSAFKSKKDIYKVKIILKKIKCKTLVLYKDTKTKISLKFQKAPSKSLTFWSIQLKPVYENQMRKIISDFEKQHPGYKVVWVDIPIQEAQKRTLASILSSDPPDLINLNPDFSVILAQRNVLEFFKDEDLTQFSEELLSKLKYDGKVYGLPYYATSPVTIYNKKLYSKCFNDAFPKTYDKLYEISPKLKSCTSTAPFAVSLNENDTLAKILNKYGIYDFSTLSDFEEAQKVYSMFDNMYKNGYLPKDTLNINHREVVEKYMSNQALSIVAGSNFINMIKQNAQDIYNSSALAPQLTADGGGYDVSIMNLIIPKKSKNKELAKEFALILTNKDNQLEFARATNVLSGNKYALSDDFFKNCSSDLVEQSRCIAASQLNNLNKNSFGEKNKKEINETINMTLEEILLNENVELEKKIKTLADKIDILQEK